MGTLSTGTVIGPQRASQGPGLAKGWRMERYRAITDLIPVLEEERAKGLYDIFEKGWRVGTSTGSRLIEEICKASEAEPDAPWRRYDKYVKQFQAKYGRVEEAPIERLGKNSILAILVFLWRRDHFDNGSMDEDIASGFAIRVLRRLKELDR